MLVTRQLGIIVYYMLFFIYHCHIIANITQVNITAFSAIHAHSSSLFMLDTIHNFLQQQPTETVSQVASHLQILKGRKPELAVYATIEPRTYLHCDPCVNTQTLISCTN